MSIFFQENYLGRLALAGSADAFVRQHSTLAQLTAGFRDTTSGASAWISVVGNQVHAGTGNKNDELFCFEGDTGSFEDLRRGFPLNRLVRQHRLTVTGDLRACVQNWLLLYAITRLTATLEN